MVEPIYLFLGIAKKASKLVSGEGNCEKTLKSGKTRLVIVCGGFIRQHKKEVL